MTEKDRIDVVLLGTPLDRFTGIRDRMESLGIRFSAKDLREFGERREPGDIIQYLEGISPRVVLFDIPSPVWPDNWREFKNVQKSPTLHGKPPSQVLVETWVTSSSDYKGLITVFSPLPRIVMVPDWTVDIIWGTHPLLKALDS